MSTAAASTAEFDRDIAVSPDGDGFSADLSPGWVVGGGVNGGYQLSTLANAVRAADPETPDPISISAYFASPGRPGPARVSVAERKRTRRFRTVAADLIQGDDVRITTLATFGRTADLEGEVRTSATPFEIPPLEECVGLAQAPSEFAANAPELLKRFDMRFHPDHLGWILGDPSGRGELACWFRLNDEREPDPVSLLTVLDAMPPVTFDLLGEIGWAPTLELTCHIRAVPAPGWLRVRHATRNFAGGLFEEDCEVWDSADRLVAQSRQLALAPR